MCAGSGAMGGGMPQQRSMYSEGGPMQIGSAGAGGAYGGYGGGGYGFGQPQSMQQSFGGGMGDYGGAMGAMRGMGGGMQQSPWAMVQRQLAQPGMGYNPGGYGQPPMAAMGAQRQMSPGGQFIAPQQQYNQNSYIPPPMQAGAPPQQDMLQGAQAGAMGAMRGGGPGALAARYQALMQKLPQQQGLLAGPYRTDSW